MYDQFKIERDDRYLYRIILSHQRKTIEINPFKQHIDQDFTMQQDNSLSQRNDYKLVILELAQMDSFRNRRLAIIG